MEYLVQSLKRMMELYMYTVCFPIICVVYGSIYTCIYVIYSENPWNSPGSQEPGLQVSLWGSKWGGWRETQPLL